MTRREAAPVTLADLAVVPAESLHWAGIAWRAGHADGYADGWKDGWVDAHAAMAARWSATAAFVRRALELPSQVELRRRRERAAS